MLSKMDLMMQMDAKSGQLKNESKNKVFSALGTPQESVSGTIINAFEVRLMIQYRVSQIIHLQFVPKGALQDLYKDAQKCAPEDPVKGALQVALELHLFMQLSMHKRVQNDSEKGEIEEALSTALESALKISF